MTPEESDINHYLNQAFRIIATQAAKDVLSQDRARIKRNLAELESFQKKGGVIPLEDALNVVDNELISLFPNKSGDGST